MHSVFLTSAGPFGATPDAAGGPVSFASFERTRAAAGHHVIGVRARFAPGCPTSAGNFESVPQ